MQASRRCWPAPPGADGEARRRHRHSTLFSIPTTRSWGIGEFSDLVDSRDGRAPPGSGCCKCSRSMDMATGEQSPYSALSHCHRSLYIAVPTRGRLQRHWPDARVVAGRNPGAAIEGPRRLCEVFGDQAALPRRAWSHFSTTEIANGSDRARALRAVHAPARPGGSTVPAVPDAARPTRAARRRGNGRPPCGMAGPTRSLDPTRARRGDR